MSATWMAILPAAVPPAHPALSLLSAALDRLPACPSNQLLMLTPMELPRRNGLMSALLRPGMTQLLILLMVASFMAELRYPKLVALGARHAAGLRRGELGRLVTSVLLHADVGHLFRSCAFGILRTLPDAGAAFGSVQSLGIFFASGAAANWLAFLAGSGGEAAALGASAAVLGLDGALLGYCLHNGVPMRSLQLAVRRSAFTLAVASLRPQGGGAAPGIALVDHVAHVFGYASGVLLGWLLAPRLVVALAHFETHMFGRMSKHVGETCGSSSVVAERAMCDYLRAYPKAMRARILSAWRLGAVPSGAEGVGMPPVPPTEEWPVVFEGLKAFVAQSLRPMRAPDMTRAPDTTRAAEGKGAGAATQSKSQRKLGMAAAEAKAGAEAEGSITLSATEAAAEARLSPQQLAYREKLRNEAEAAVWRHFAHRAQVAAPSLRLLRHAQLGHVSLRTLRRMRVPTGSLVPSGVAETLAALVLVWVGASCHDALRRATMPGG